jgi:3'(2'), 5'-bisphosphate nucleotidase
MIDIEIIKGAARKAGEVILEVYAKDFAVEFKGDSSPLTEADQRANTVILDLLAAHYPEIPVISEETKALPYAVRKNWSRCWLVDPLDGTKEFIKKNGEFTVNIALIEEGAPVLGVVFQPVTGTLYAAQAGKGSWREEAGAEPTLLWNDKHYTTEKQITVVASRSHLTPEVEAFVDLLRVGGKDVEFLSSGSSLKLCLVAEGKATVYPRFGPTMEWDTAAADAVVRGAGKSVLRHDTGEPLVYNKEDLLNPWFMVE